MAYLHIASIVIKTRCLTHHKSGLLENTHPNNKSKESIVRNPRDNQTNSSYHPWNHPRSPATSLKHQAWYCEKVNTRHKQTTTHIYRTKQRRMQLTNNTLMSHNSVFRQTNWPAKQILCQPNNIQPPTITVKSRHSNKSINHTKPRAKSFGIIHTVTKQHNVLQSKNPKEPTQQICTTKQIDNAASQIINLPHNHCPVNTITYAKYTRLTNNRTNYRSCSSTISPNSRLNNLNKQHNHTYVNQTTSFNIHANNKSSNKPNRQQAVTHVKQIQIPPMH
eukprot:gene3339-2321_t